MGLGSNTDSGSVPQEAREALDRHPNSTFKAAGKRTTTKKEPQSQHKEGDHENQSRDK